MTTWIYRVADEHSTYVVNSIELNRCRMKFNCAGDGIPDWHELLFINEYNRLQLLFFAQKLISLINETNPEWVLKNHIVVSSKAIKEFSNES